MKAKLIIDIPETCDDCRLLCKFEDGYHACCAPLFLRHFTEEENDYIEEKRGDWCPLEPIPEESILKTLDDIDAIIKEGEGK